MILEVLGEYYIPLRNGCHTVSRSYDIQGQSYKVSQKCRNDKILTDLNRGYMELVGLKARSCVKYKSMLDRTQPRFPLERAVVVMPVMVCPLLVSVEACPRT